MGQRQFITVIKKQTFFLQDGVPYHRVTKEESAELAKLAALPTSLMLFTKEHHSCYREKSIFPSYMAKLNLTLFSLTNLIIDAYSD